MPTENRSSNTEMVSVPRELLQRIDRMYTDGMSIFGECEEVRAIMALPAEQHQRAPVALPARKPSPTEESDVFTDAENSGFNYCLGEIAKLGPLYTHADPGEVERLREALAAQQRIHQRYSDAMCELGELLGIPEDDQCTPAVIDAVRSMNAQLAERDALLDRVVDHAKFWHDHPYAEVVEAIAKDYKALSASAEPSAPTHDPKLISIVHTPPAEYDEP